ncbi:hypothetical protein BDD12DRAFT_807595 [Trichophaea hybrida]|nr:hypothetical protein BDD12DRAFT_807595 [Trichophaea hybrida]
MPPRLPLPRRTSATTTTLFHRTLSRPPQYLQPYSAVNSTTSIEAPPFTPSPHPHEQLKHILTTLSTLGHGGSPSRIELALRGLEQKDAPVRIVVVGSDILTAIFGGDEGWSGELKEWIAQGGKPGRGLLLRFGTYPKLTTLAGSPLSILTAPMEVLRTNNIEIVVTSRISPDPLVLLFQPTDTPGARVIEYPVHKTLFYGGSGAEGVARLLETITPTMYRPQQVLRVISLPGVVAKNEHIQVIDLDRGQGIEDVRSWLLAGTTTSNTLKPAIKSLLHDIFTSASHELSTSTTSTTTPTRIEDGDTPETLASAIITWSHTAHLELKTSAESQEWRKLEWWKLLWRVDDVGNVSQHIVTSTFLTQSEEDVAFLAGRLFSAGYNNPNSLELELQLDRPMYIQEKRNEIMTTLIPNLQATAQKYLFSSLSTSALSAASSALLYLSDVPLYSALTMAAVGTVGSVRWLQSRWMREKRGFQETVRERGREAIVDSERWAWSKLKEGIKTEVGEGELEREKIERLKSALRDGIKLCGEQEY